MQYGVPPVASLTILDSSAPQELPLSTANSDTEILKNLIEIYEQIAEQSLRISDSDLDGLDGEAQIALLHGRLVSIGLMPRKSKPAALTGTFKTFAACLKTPYIPNATYLGPLNLVLASVQNLPVRRQELAMVQRAQEWRKVAPGLTCYRATGNHMTILKEPHVKKIAQLLQTLPH